MQPDTAYLYATTRIRSLEKSLLTAERCQRLFDAGPEEDALRVLEECGYDTARARDLEEILREALSGTYAMISDLTPDASLADFFKIKYDTHNMKVWIKSEQNDSLEERLLSPLGRVTPDAFLEAVRNLRFQDLPPDMRDALTEARGLLARTRDPQQADLSLDRAMLAEMLNTAKRSECDFLIGYARLYIDVTNLRIVTRALRMGHDADFLENALLPGGTVDVSRLVTAVSGGTGFAELYHAGPLAQAASLAVPAANRSEPLTAFEQACENALTACLRSARYVSFGAAPLVAYLAARESELPSIRTIMAARRAGTSREVTMGRVRETIF